MTELATTHTQLIIFKQTKLNKMATVKITMYDVINEKEVIRIIDRSILLVNDNSANLGCEGDIIGNDAEIKRNINIWIDERANKQHDTWLDLISYEIVNEVQQNQTTEPNETEVNPQNKNASTKMEKIKELLNELRLLGFEVSVRHFPSNGKCKVHLEKGGYTGGRVFNPLDDEMVGLAIERFEELIACEKLEIKKKQSDVFNNDYYSDFSKQLALSNTLNELECELKKLEKAMEKATQTHLKAINRTSMAHGNQGNEQARAQCRNVVDRLSVALMQHRHAIELHGLYPEKCKK